MSKLENMNIDLSMVSLEHMQMTPNNDGSYRVIVGAFNVWSGNGHFFEMTEGIRALYAEDSVLQQRVRSGDVFVEEGHPPYIPGMDVIVYLESLMTLTESKVCGQITYLKLDDEPTAVIGHREPIYLVRADIKPYGPRKAVLEKSFRDPTANTAFSVRGLNHAKRIAGMLHKEIHTIMTYDYVARPGINVASKASWENMSLEGLDIALSGMDMNRLKERLDARLEGATESESLLINHIRDAMDTCDTGDCIYKVW